MKRTQIVSKNNELDQKIRLMLCIKKRDWINILIAIEASFYLLSPETYK